MAKYEVKKVPLMDFKAKKQLSIGDVIERNVKDVEKFEKRFGEEYLKRVEEVVEEKKDAPDKKVK